MSRAVAKKADEALPTETGGMQIAPLIERIMTDPTIPIDRVEQAFSFYQKVQADEARKAFAAAFAAMQPDLPAVERKGTGHNNKKYARWEDIAGAVMPVLAKHGFGLRFNISDAEKNIRVTCILSHRAGHSEETTASFPHDASGNKNAIQAIGSAKTYGQRYTATAILGIATCGEDDDGNAAGGKSENREELIAKMKALANEKGVSEAKILERYSVAEFDDLTAKQINAAIVGLSKTRAA